MLYFFIVGLLSLIYMVYLYMNSIKIEAKFSNYSHFRRGYIVFCEFNRNNEIIKTEFRVMFKYKIKNLTEGDKINIHIVPLKNKIICVGFERLNKPLLLITIISFLYVGISMLEEVI